MKWKGHKLIICFTSHYFVVEVKKKFRNWSFWQLAMYSDTKLNETAFVWLYLVGYAEILSIFGQNSISLLKTFSFFLFNGAYLWAYDTKDNLIFRDFSVNEELKGQEPTFASQLHSPMCEITEVTFWSAQKANFSAKIVKCDYHDCKICFI